MPTASAEPDGAVHTDPAPIPAPAPSPAPVGSPDPMAAPAPVGVPDPAAPPVAAGDIGPAAVTACSQFADALDNAATFYGDFADTIEGTERPDYADPIVNMSNTSGRTALRESAAQAMSAANTPGLSPDIASPMRSWSLDATKLLLKMGLRGSGNTLNVTANELNEDAHNAQMACALAGTHA
ncbi:hypothetical protein [Mycolicibacterium neworleansense]|uniref:Uncharacterized protein n=1 Tax=Mycolicibacterium neworleansense TaxID=146018 RepID=A0A0H5RXE5_9MYCO|nr:hypothetical protein [Mycolicibacterium neworleansense]MCV7362198.1 hypothetical protein [Mycolicibacterium neworleansense]CRZ13394.1 hypothetical protein BN2156_00226 [Mycolicibacterium neworleansense]